MLAGGTSFAISFALFRFVLPVGTWVVSAPELMVSLFFAALIAMLVMAITTALLRR